ncbi:structural cement protein Gp24 [Sandarakinorhabdus sp. DWP1-3-1]|uniref:structural cement protein Gp24 n=1 Tax=Sandarakinorhabdus sp. DWP1-3-1 TaxID=2804627 RepID=UPI003CE95E36
MPAVQTTYDASIPLGFPGQVANGETSNRISRTVEDAAGIAFGKAAFRGAGDHGVTATPTAGGLMGFVIADHGVQILPGGVAADIVPQYGSAALLALGMMWVVAGEAVTDGAQVYITAGGLIVDTAGANIIAPGWFFDDTAASGAMVRIVRR